ncbi:hypothetical protein POV27_05735 [Aureisphaera galaxeae]|uniref:hypothetical protein n=1 Tax=Aureisphaera galaxeae TaxID=1538023 RepID=UPI0023504D41|nr:hypothetical protein [Aureisphaera galaxeae]MDC8003542.1 hypothetical protein [Aureisphaera galaxeae]
MKRLFYLGILVLACCSESQRKDFVEKEHRDLIVYDYDKLIRENQCELTRIEKDSIILFKYKNLVDSTKNMVFSFLKYKDLLYFGPNEFTLKERKYLVKEVAFDKYETEPIVDGMGPILFNAKYGILVMENGWGKQFHYLKENGPWNLELPILYDF